MKYTVVLMMEYCTWEGIEAESEDDAIRKVDTPPELDSNIPHAFRAFEEEE